MHSLLRIANILNVRYIKIKKSTCDNITSQDCDNKEASKSKSKTLFKSITFKIQKIMQTNNVTSYY